MANHSYWADEVAQLSKLSFQLGTTFESGESISSDFTEVKGKLLTLGTCLDRLLDASHRNTIVFDSSKGRDSLVKIIDGCRKTLYRVESIVDKYSDKLDVDGRAWKKWFSKGWRKVDWTSRGGSLKELKTDLDRHCDVINLVVDTLTMSPDEDAAPIIHELDSQVLAPTISTSSLPPMVSSSVSTKAERRSSAPTPSKYFNPSIPGDYNLFEGYPRVFADIITDSKKIMKRTFQISYRNSTAAVCPEAMINPNLYSSQFQAHVEPLFICRCFSAGVLRTGIHSNFTQSIKCGPSTVIVHNENPRHIRPGHAMKEYILCQPALGEPVNPYDYERNPIVVRVPNNKVGYQAAFEGSIVQILAMKAARSLCENRLMENKWVRWERDRIYERENRGRVLVAASIRLHLDRDDALALRYLAPDTMRSWPHDLGIDMMTIVDYRSIEKSNLYSSNMTRDPTCWEDTESVVLHANLEAAGHMAVERSFHCEYLGKEPKITGSVITCDVSTLIHFEDGKPIVSQLTFPEVLHTVNISSGEKGMVWLDASNRPVPSLETAIMSQEAGTFGSLLMQTGRWMLEFRATRCSRHEDIVLLSSLRNISIFGSSEGLRFDFHESTLALLRNQVRNSSRLVVRGNSGHILSQNVTTETSGTTVDLNERDDELAVSNSDAIFAFLRKDKEVEMVFFEHESKPLVYHFKESEDAVTCIFKIADPGVNEVLPENKIREEAMANIKIERRGSTQSQSFGLNGMNVFYSELPATTPAQNTVMAPSVELPAMPVLPEVNPTVVRNSLDPSKRASVAPETMYPASNRTKRQSSPDDLVRSQSSPGHNLGAFRAPLQPMGLSLDGMPTSTSVLPLPPNPTPALTPTPSSNYIPPPPTRVPPPKPSKPDFFGDLENLRRRLSPIKLEISLNEDTSSVVCPSATVHPELVTPPGSIETATPQLLACNCDEQSKGNTGHLADFRAGPFTLAILALGHHFAKRPGCYALVNVVAKTMMGQELYLRCQNPEDDHIIGEALGGFLRLRAARSVHLGLSAAEAVPISVEDSEKISLLSSFGNVEASPEVYFRKERNWDILSKRARSLNMSQYISLKRTNLSEQLSANLKGEYLHGGKPILRFNMDDMTEFAAVIESAPKWHAEYDSAIIYTVMMDVSGAIVSLSDEEHEKMGPGRLKFNYKGYYPKEKVAQRDAFQSLAWFDFWRSRIKISRLYKLGNHEEQVYSAEIETLKTEIENSNYFDGIFDGSNVTIVQDQELNRLRVVSKEPKNNWILIQEVLLGTFPLDTTKTSRTAINHSAIGSRMFRLSQETVIADPSNEMCWRVAGGIQYTFKSTTDRDDFCESLAKAADFMESLEEEQLQTFVEDPHITETVELVDQTVLDNSMPSLLRRSTMPRIDMEESVVPPMPPSPYSGSSTASKNAVLPRISIPPPPPLPIPPTTLLSARSSLSRTNSDRFSTMSPISVVSPANTESSTASIYRVTSRYVAKQPNELTCWPGEIVRTETEDPNDTEWVYGIKRGIASNTTRHTQTIVAGWVPRRCLQRDSQYDESTEEENERIQA